MTLHPTDELERRRFMTFFVMVIASFLMLEVVTIILFSSYISTRLILFRGDPFESIKLTRRLGIYEGLAVLLEGFVECGILIVVSLRRARRLTSALPETSG